MYSLYPWLLLHSTFLVFSCFSIKRNCLCSTISLFPIFVSQKFDSVFAKKFSGQYIFWQANLPEKHYLLSSLLIAWLNQTLDCKPSPYLPLLPNSEMVNHWIVLFTFYVCFLNSFYLFLHFSNILHIFKLSFASLIWYFILGSWDIDFVTAAFKF